MPHSYCYLCYLSIPPKNIRKPKGFLIFPGVIDKQISPKNIYISQILQKLNNQVKKKKTENFVFLLLA